MLSIATKKQYVVQESVADAKVNARQCGKPVTKVWSLLYIQDGRQLPSGIFKFESCTIRSAVNENPTLEPNIMSLSCTRNTLEYKVIKLYQFKYLKQNGGRLPSSSRSSHQVAIESLFAIPSH